MRRPLGISESSYADFTVDGDYHYQAFGTPGLGLKRDLERDLAAAARAEGLEPRHVVLDRYGSDASNVYADGGVGRAACIAMSTDNTHGYEIAHLDAVANVTRTLARWLA